MNIVAFVVSVVVAITYDNIINVGLLFCIECARFKRMNVDRTKKGIYKVVVVGTSEWI